MDLLLGGSTSSCTDGFMAVSRAVAPLNSSMRNGKWYSAAAEPCSNDADYEKFSSDAARSHVTVRGFDSRVRMIITQGRRIVFDYMWFDCMCSGPRY